jgi:hypothetical protein
MHIYVHMHVYTPSLGDGNNLHIIYTYVYINCSTYLHIPTYMLQAITRTSQWLQSHKLLHKYTNMGNTNEFHEYPIKEGNITCLSS